MAFPVTSIIDTFTGTDNTTPPSADWTNNYNTLKILSNQCAGGTVSDFNCASRAIVITSDNCETYCEISTLPSNNEKIITTIFSSTTGSGYLLEYTKLSGTDTVKVFKLTEGWYGTQVGQLSIRILLLEIASAGTSTMAPFRCTESHPGVHGHN
jgi:hypothetical protein